MLIFYKVNNILHYKFIIYNKEEQQQPVTLYYKV